MDSVERYDPATNRWEVMAPMSTQRSSHAAAVIEGKLYAVGGKGDGGPSDSVERYDPAANTWEVMAPMGAGIDQLACVAM